MSLDVCLKKSESEIEYHECPHCCGTGKHATDGTSHYSGNITHNLSEMARKAGIYEALWRPEEIAATKAKDIISILETGLDRLKSRPQYFRKFDSPNGWGRYEHFVEFVAEYLAACKEHPEAEIEVSR